MTLFFGADKKKMYTFRAKINRTTYKIRASNPASAARKAFKQRSGFKSKGPQIITVINNKAKSFKYRVSFHKVNKTVEYEDSKSVTFKYKIKVKAIKKAASKSKKSPTKSKSASKKSPTKSKSASKCKCSDPRCDCSVHSSSKSKSSTKTKRSSRKTIKPASGGWM